MKTPILQLSIFTVLFSQTVFAGQFCVVDRAGNQSSCFSFFPPCQQLAASMGGVCAYTGTQPQNQGPCSGPPSFLTGLCQGQQMRLQQQEAQRQQDAFDQQQQIQQKELEQQRQRQQQADELMRQQQRQRQRQEDELLQQQQQQQANEQQKIAAQQQELQREQIENQRLQNELLRKKLKEAKLSVEPQNVGGVRSDGPPPIDIESMPEFRKWWIANQWYSEDRPRHEFAKIYASQLAQKRPDLRGHAFLEAVSSKVTKTFGPLN